MRSRELLIVTSALAALAACAEAGGEVRGGDISEAGAAALKAPEPPPEPDAGPPPEILNVGSGSKWSDLYRDLFGPTGRPGSCSFLGSCHGSPEGAGAKSGSGIECYNEKKCRQSMFDKFLVRPSDAAAPEKSSLLRDFLWTKQPDGTITGYMPKEPKKSPYPPESLDRIKRWIADGMPDN